MEEESEELEYSYSKDKYKNSSNKFMLSNLSISEDPIPLLIKSPKSRNNKNNITNNNKKETNKDNLGNKFSLFFMKKNIKIYDTTPEKFNVIVIDNLINLKENRLVAVFKDNLINNNENEFLRGNFNIKECTEVIPKFYEYYKNYLMFFCKPTFTNFYLNEKIQDYGERQAEVYYHNNYNAKKRRDKKENIDDKNIQDDEDKSSKLNSSENNETSFVSFRTFFTNTVESMIKKGIISKSRKNEEEQDKELSNIKPIPIDSNENTINLPDDSSISIENIITKKNSIKNIIDLMKNIKIDKNKIKERKNNLSNQKQKQTKKRGIIIIDKKKLIEGRNLFNKNRFNSFSKTNLNLLEKNKSRKIIFNNNNVNNNQINNNIKNINSNKKTQPNSNYLKYVGVIKQNKYNKINNIPKIKVSENDLILSPTENIRTKRRKSLNKIPSFKTNENNYNLNLMTSSNKNINNLKNSKVKNSSKNLTNTNKINLPLKIKNFYKKIKNIANNSNSSIQMSLCKTTNNRNNSVKRFYINNNHNVNRTNYNFNKNNKHIKKLKVLPLLSPKSRRNFNYNKSLSYSTINNCNININNNIILSNNYIYNNKYLFSHNSQKQLHINTNFYKHLSKPKSKDKNNKKENKEPKKIKHTIPLTSRNIRINLDQFKTEENFLNSLISHGKSTKTQLKNEKSDNNIQYTSFRKANNKEVVHNKNRNVFKIKKLNINNKSNNNLVLKNLLVMNKTKSNLNKTKENSSITKTYKSIYIKNNSINNNNNQKKLIFEYKKKYV